jgi:hypothetical protein
LPQLKASPNKDWVRFAGDGIEGIDTEIVNRTDHVMEAHEICSPKHGKQKCAEECSNKTFDSLLRRELDKRSSPNRLAPDVGEAVVADDKGGRNPKPDEPFKDIVDNEVAKIMA